MRDFFLFRFDSLDSIKKTNLVIFTPVKIELDSLEDIIKKEITQKLSPETVYLITFKSNKENLIEIINNSMFNQQFESFIGDISSKLKLIFVDKNGKFSDKDENIVCEKLSEKIKTSGMFTLFEKHKCLIESNHGYHFVKPSGDHCKQFIRASNLLVSSTEVSFLSLALLPHLKKNLKRIYVDTSSISFLVTLAIQNYHSFESGPPSIFSFFSYDNFNDSQPFIVDDGSLVIVSASTSGSLVSKIKAKNSGFKDWQIITLFSTVENKGQNILFDISKKVNIEEIFTRPDDCKYCKSDSKLIQIAGEQFLTANPKHDDLIIKKNDFNSNREKFFKQFACRNVLKLCLAIDKFSDNDHFYLSVETALNIKENTPFSNSLTRGLKKHLTLDLNTIIYTNDPGTKELKSKVENYLPESNRKAINWLIDGNDSIDLTKTKSVLVLAGVITSGRKLLSISRKLRGLSESASITYLVAFSKMPTKKSFEQLKKDLELGGHSINVLTDCYIPRTKEKNYTSWTRELAFIRDSIEFMSEGEIKNRISTLEDTSPRDTELFLPKPKGGQLELRPTFAFWSNLEFDIEKFKKATQADVYWTIQTILYDIRVAKKNGEMSTPYHITLLSPFNFDRFNDGVIQACLLRAAHSSELDYSIDETYSRNMTDIILSVLKNYNNDQGEAALEFLLALCTKHLRVTSKHLNEISLLVESILNEINSSDYCLHPIAIFIMENFPKSKVISEVQK